MQRNPRMRENYVDTLDSSLKNTHMHINFKAIKIIFKKNADRHTVSRSQDRSLQEILNLYDFISAAYEQLILFIKELPHKKRSIN